MADVLITVQAKTLEGLGAVDPQVTVDVLETSPAQHLVAHAVVRGFAGERAVSVPAPDDFPVWQVNLAFSRFDVHSGFVLEPRGEPAKTFVVQVVRLPDRWTPRFTPYAALPAMRFDPFRAVVAVSTDVDLKHGLAVGNLEERYDSITDGPQVLAKTALLNLFSVLVDEVDPIGEVAWFRYVRKIVRIDQERFLAEVNSALMESVETILEHIDAYGAQGYSAEPDIDLQLHIPNIPAQYDPGKNLQKIITVKKAYEQGDLQLTVSYLIVDGVAVHLLDCDLDENRNLVAHGLDLIKHLFNGGTSPITMHEYIVETSAKLAADGISTVDLGYELV